MCSNFFSLFAAFAGSSRCLPRQSSHSLEAANTGEGVDLKAFHNIINSNLLHPEASVLPPRVHPCSVCCCGFSAVAFIFLVRDGVVHGVAALFGTTVPCLCCHMAMTIFLRG